MTIYWDKGSGRRIRRPLRRREGVDRRHAGLGLPCEVCPGPCGIDAPVDTAPEQDIPLDRRDTRA